MKIINNFDNRLAIKVLGRGGLVIFPCETVYGIACDSQSKDAVIKLNNYKQRPFGKPYAIMCSDIKMAQRYVKINQTARKLYKKFLPGPLTIVSNGKHKVAFGIESENGTLGIRIPYYPDLLKLISEFKRPIVATSANASYKKRPYKIADILNNISKRQKRLIDLIIDVGELPHNEPSTVIDTTQDEPLILRLGEIKLKNKNEIFSRSEENTQNIAKELWQKYENYAGKRAIIFALEGQMGSGKTQFVKGLGRAMNIKEPIISPSFELINNYLSQYYKRSFIHIDTWRMLSPKKEIKELGIKNLIDDRSVIAIEWADRAADEIRNYLNDAIIIWVKIEYGRKENERFITWGTL